LPSHLDEPNFSSFQTRVNESTRPSTGPSLSPWLSVVVVEASASAITIIPLLLDSEEDLGARTTTHQVSQNLLDVSIWKILGGELELMRLTSAGFGATTTNATGFGSTATANPFSGGVSGFGQNTGGTWNTENICLLVIIKTGTRSTRHRLIRSSSTRCLVQMAFRHPALPAYTAQSRQHALEFLSPGLYLHQLPRLHYLPYQKMTPN
jgi:hypothetical protein